MKASVFFILNSVLLGFGLAMDAFSVSIADGLGDPDMGRRWQLAIPCAFAAFQFAMPLVGWLCVRTIADAFQAFQRALPLASFLLLAVIGARMIAEGLGRGGEAEPQAARLTPGMLAVQGVATSIDALSVGFAIAAYRFRSALAAASIVALVTWLACALGLSAGRRLGLRLAGRATAAGGVVLAAIGTEILLRSLLPG